MPNLRHPLLLALSAVVAVYGQAPSATIRVTVHSAANPVPDATVTFNRVTLRTDRDGIAIAPIALGQTEIKVAKKGFLPATASISVDDAREWQITIELQPEPVIEEEITVHATRTDARLQDSPTRVEVLGPEEIEEKTMMTPGDIVMMLNEMGGLRVQTTSPSLGAASVRIQGMRGRYTRFLTDGLPLFGQQGGGLGLLQVPPMDLGQVEVIKGVSSALYGAGAMAGVVNLISRRPRAEAVHEVLVNRTSLGATDLAVFLASPLSPHWSASVLAGGHWQERKDRDGDGWADLAGYSRAVVRPRAFWSGENGRSVFATVGGMWEERRGGTMPSAVLPVTDAPYPESVDTTRIDGGPMDALASTLLTSASSMSGAEMRDTSASISDPMSRPDEALAAIDSM